MVFKAVQTAGRFIDGCYARASRCQLRGLAARRRAEIGNVSTGDIAEHFDRQRGGGVLHPPLPGVVAVKVFDAARA